MEKSVLPLNDYTISAREYCYISTQSEAERQFLAQGIYGKVTLERVNSPGAELNKDIHLKNGKSLGEVKFFWVCRNNDGECFLPLFFEDLNEEDYLYVSSEPVKKTTLLHKGGINYLLHVDSRGRVTVRIITVFCRQDLVEALEFLQGVVPKEIYLVHILTIPDNKDISTCWSVITDADTGDEDDEMCILLPVSLYDADMLNKIGINNLNTSVVYENSVLKANGIYYKLRKDAEGKRYLEKLPMQLLQHRKNDEAEFDRYLQKALERQKAGKTLTVVSLFNKDGE